MVLTRVSCGMRCESTESGCGSTSFSDPPKDTYFRFRSLIGLYCEEEDVTGGLHYVVSLSRLPCMLQKNSAISSQGVPSNTKVGVKSGENCAFGQP
jgi:hypothetical protein